MLEKGMEKQYQFTTGPQAEGERLTAAYIADTMYFYALGAQLQETPEEQMQRRKELKK